MTTVKTLQERERELQAQLLTPGGEAELEALAASYEEAGGDRRAWGSVITYILVYERGRGKIKL
jgi:hypothetical protein